MRDIYEVPAAALVLTAHEELERLVGTIHQNQFKPELDRKWGYLVYAGLWWEPLRSDLDAYMDAVNAQVTGEIGLRLYKGGVRVVTRSSPNAVYDADLAELRAVGRALLSDRIAGLHRALVAAVADGAHDSGTRWGEGGRLMNERLGKDRGPLRVRLHPAALQARDPDRRRRRPRWASPSPFFSLPATSARARPGDAPPQLPLRVIDNL